MSATADMSDPSPERGPVQLRQESQDGMFLLLVSGPVRNADAAGLVSAVQRAMQEPSRGVVVDLVGTTGFAGGALVALNGLAKHVPAWSQPSLAIAASDPKIVSGLTSFAVYDNRQAAVRHLGDRSGCTRERVELRHGLEGPAQARAVVAEWSARLGFEDVRDDVTLVVSEMVTNAVRHASPPVALELQEEDGLVHIAVRDGSPDAPAPRAAPSDAEGGRGLLLVDLLCEDHGVRPDPPGKTVWATLPRP